MLRYRTGLCSLCVSGFEFFYETNYRAECFGLLGNNGAGKTSIFKMLTGEERISSGQIFLHGLNLKSDLRKVYKFIGYCPQFDALFENLSGREILEIFAMIRGVKRNEISAYALRAATDLDLTEHVDKKVSQLSGGNKRKLSTAIALVGNPKVIFLDEPTTGMDPATKRNLWNIIIKLRDQGKSIVLTSHSMEECEAVRLANLQIKYRNTLIMMHFAYSFVLNLPSW